MATDPRTNGKVQVDALLGALRRAAENDGVEDVDAVVAQFATFVRAQAPHLAVSAHTTPNRSRRGWATATLAVGAITAAIGAVVTGAVPNPFLQSPAPASAVAAGGETAGLDAGPVVVDGGVPSPGTPGGDAGAIAPATDPATVTEPGISEVGAWQMVFSDPDAAPLADAASLPPGDPTAPATVPADTSVPSAPETAAAPTTAAPTTAPATGPGATATSLAPSPPTSADHGSGAAGTSSDDAPPAPPADPASPAGPTGSADGEPPAGDHTGDHTGGPERADDAGLATSAASGHSTETGAE